MISKTKDRQLAEQLRLQGMSYREIIRQIPVSKSTLSLWLGKIALTPAQHSRLNSLFKQGQKAGAIARNKQRISKTIELRENTMEGFDTLAADPFFNFGLSLYWAEGSKQKPWNISARVQFSNSDPLTIMVMQKWFRRFAGSINSDFIYDLYIHKTTNTESARQSWSKQLSISPRAINIIYKNNNSSFRHNKEANYIGQIRLTVKKSTWLNRQIAIWIELATKKFLNI